MNLSTTDIANAALGLVGAEKILNLVTDTSHPAKTCRFYWPIILQAVLESHPWKCVAQPAVLTTTTTAPPFGFDYAYPLPADFVRMVGLEEPDAQYRVYGGKVLHTDESPACINYVPLETDCTRYSAGLVRVLYLNLGYELALALRQDAGLAQQIRGDLEKFFLPIARMVDSVEQGEVTIQSSTLTDMFA